MTESEIFHRMLELDRTEKLSYAERGELCLWVKNQMLHRERLNPETKEPCTLSEWIRLCSPWGYASSWQALRDFEALRDIPMTDLADMPKGNIQTLTQLSTAVRSDPKVIDGAKRLSSNDFIEQVQRDHPQQHISKPETLRFVVDQSEKTIVEEVIKAQMERGAMNRTQALISVFMDAWVKMNSEELSK